jgi:CRISPR-associated protein Cas1
VFRLPSRGGRRAVIAARGRSDEDKVVAPLFLTGPQTTLRRAGDALVVTREGDGDRPAREVLLTLPPHQVEMVGLVGDAHITADATRLCLDQGIGVAWLTPGGLLRGRLTPPACRCADLRLRQYAAWHDPAGRLRRARAVVAAKLRGAAQVLRGLHGNHPQLTDLGAAASRLKGLADRAEAADGRDSLLGLEGAGARAYFEALSGAFLGDIALAGRAHHPPPDPANALLSLAYTLLTNNLAGLLEARGLDPCLGFFHEVHGARPSLALDLLEEFRHPVADRFVLRLCNLRIMRPDRFEPDPDRPGGVRLTRPAYRRFFHEWEEFLREPRRERDETEPRDVRPLLRRQVERLVADLRCGEPYRPVAFGD